MKIKINRNIRDMYKKMSREERKQEIAILRVEIQALNKQMDTLVMAKSYLRYLKKLNK